MQPRGKCASVGHTFLLQSYPGPLCIGTPAGFLKGWGAAKSAGSITGAIRNIGVYMPVPVRERIADCGYAELCIEVCYGSLSVLKLPETQIPLMLDLATSSMSPILSSGLNSVRSNPTEPPKAQNPKIPKP